MSKFYVACDLGAENGRVMMGTLNQGSLTISEVRRFQNLPIREQDSLQWNIPQLYQETLDGLHAVGTYEEAVESISCDSWPADYLLFEADNSLITPAYHYGDPRTNEGMQKVLSIVARDTIYQETGVCPIPANTLFQLGAERPRRLHRANHLLPVADAFNYLLAGVPRFERSMTGATQLYNPITQTWSNRLLDAAQVLPKLFPPLVPAGTELGPLRPEIATRTGLEDARVIASCSHETAAALVGLPLRPGEDWAYLRLGSRVTMGTEITTPIITDTSRERGFTNETGYGGAVRFSKQTVGLWILEECRRFWKGKDRENEDSLLSHIGGGGRCGGGAGAVTGRAGAGASPAGNLVGAGVSGPRLVIRRRACRFPETPAGGGYGWGAAVCATPWLRSAGCARASRRSFAPPLPACARCRPPARIAS